MKYLVLAAVVVYMMMVQQLAAILKVDIAAAVAFVAVGVLAGVGLERLDRK